MRAMLALAATMALAIPAAAASAVPADAQRKVWTAEENMVKVLLEKQNKFLKLTAVVSAQDAYFSGIPGPLAGYKKLHADAVAAQQKLVDLGVMRPSGNGDFRFAHAGRAPSDEAKKAFEAYGEAVSAFDSSVDVKIVVLAMQGKLSKDQNDIPPAMKQAFNDYVGFVRQFGQVVQAAATLLGKAIENNGGQFNSRWGLE